MGARPRMTYYLAGDKQLNDVRHFERPVELAEAEELGLDTGVTREESASSVDDEPIEGRRCERVLRRVEE